jgi:acyl carrier protein
MILDEVKELLQKALFDTDRLVEVGDDDDIVNGLGLDSLQMIGFLLEVEARFGVALDFERLDIATLGSVRSFARFIEQLKDARATG